MKRIVIAGLVALVAVVILLAQRRGYSDEEHDRFQSALWRLKQLDASFNEDLLRARFALLENYDEFQRQRDEMTRLAAGLGATPRFVGESARADIRQAAIDLAALLRQRDALFENFKSRNAILANSRRYFPIAVGDLEKRIGDIGADRELRAILDDVTRLLLATAATSEALPAEALTEPDRLRDWVGRQPRHPEAGFASSLAQHAHELLAGKGELDRLTRSLLALPVDPAIERLSRLYEGELTAALHRSQQYRTLLYVIGALLAAVIAYALWAQREANRSLEARVQDRTRALENEAEERRRADEARHASERFLQSLVENLPVHIFRTDREGRLTFANMLFCQRFGQPLAALVGKTAAELLPPAAAERQAASDRVVLTSGKNYEATEETVEPGGSSRFIQIIKVPIFDLAGRCEGIQSMFLDVTERKLAETKFTEASGLLDALLENTPDHIYFKDRESRFMRFSNAVLQHWNLTGGDQLRGKTDADFYSAEHAQPAYADEQEIIRTGRPIVGKLEREVDRGGKVSWVLTTKMPWRDGTGAIIGTFGISRDITAIKESEDKLAYERDQLRALLDASPDTIYFKDTESRLCSRASPRSGARSSACPTCATAAPSAASALTCPRPTCSRA